MENVLRTNENTVAWNLSEIQKIVTQRRLYIQKYKCQYKY